MLFSRLFKRFTSVRFLSGLGRNPPEETASQDGSKEQSSEKPEMGAEAQDEYFKKEQQKRVETLKDNLQEEIDFHEEQIKKHKEAVTHYKKEVDDIKPH
ncbi:ATPase inhibitor mai-2, mitochondrial-like [Coccinella septempunctata]|uniref:ATPase inhibitor mai-2, mitochondrial-like n=1 Tax=Coccinella septempunctata TaxID=41139 RepID=UPI001D0899F1|nr:ATPase inhibitor mai-2, mitochondrial-like [Coccinella septempunctata]